jgi:DNA-binding LacI/PurR family transcriptional regulator
MSVTIQDVAKRAGVGVGTVSRVLNNQPFVSDGTRERVLKAIAELNYRPNLSARNLSLGRTNAIGVVTPFFTRPAFINRLSGIQAQLSATVYDLILFSVNSPQQRDEYFSDIVNLKRVDGILIISLVIQDSDLDALRQWQVPVVLCDSCHESLPSVVVDDVAGGRLATEYLIQLGHTQIAYIGDNFENPFGFTSSLHRFEGYQLALEAAGIPFRPDLHKQGEHGSYIAHQRTLELLDLDQPPTAIFAGSDTQAVGVIEALRSRDLRIPEDISVIGYDDIEVAKYLNLTTVRQPMYTSGQKAVLLLMDLIESNTCDEMRIVMNVEVVERATTGVVPT